MFICQFFLLTALVYNTICWSSNAGCGNSEGQTLYSADTDDYVQEYDDGSSKEEKRPGIGKILDFISFMFCSIVGGCGKKYHRGSSDITPGNHHGHAIDAEASHGFGKNIEIVGNGNKVKLGVAKNESVPDWAVDIVDNNKEFIVPNKPTSGNISLHITGDYNEVTSGQKIKIGNASYVGPIKSGSASEIESLSSEEDE